MDGIPVDTFVEDDGGAPLEEGRVVLARGGAIAGSGGKYTQSFWEEKTAKRCDLLLLDDLWKLDIKTLQWERVRADYVLSSSTRFEH